MSRKKISVSIIASTIAIIISFSLSFFLTKFLVNEFSSEANAYYSLAKTITSYFSVITIAVNSFIARYIAIEYHKRNYDESSSFLSTAVYANLFLASIFCLIYILFILFINLFLNISPGYLLDVRILFGLVGINFIVSLFSMIFQISFFATDKLTMGAIVRLAGCFVEAVLLIVLFQLNSRRLYYVGIALIVSSVIVFIMSMVFTKKQGAGF